MWSWIQLGDFTLPLSNKELRGWVIKREITMTKGDREGNKLKLSGTASTRKVHRCILLQSNCVIVVDVEFDVELMGRASLGPVVYTCKLRTYGLNLRQEEDLWSNLRQIEHLWSVIKLSAATKSS